MTKLELMTVLRSVRLALKTSTKEQVEELIDDLISDAEGTPKTKKSDKETTSEQQTGLQLSWLEHSADNREVGGSSPLEPSFQQEDGNMATAIENYKMELLIEALYDTGNGEKVVEVNKKVLEYIAHGKVPTEKKEKPTKEQCKIVMPRGYSSAGEHLPCTQGVWGSNPHTSSRNYLITVIIPRKWVSYMQQIEVSKKEVTCQQS